MSKEKENILEFEGVVVDSAKGKFKVKVNDNYFVLCSLSGKIRKSEIRILNGDTCRIEVSAYDTSIGRITFRMK